MNCEQPIIFINMYKNFDLVLDSRLKFTVQPLYYNILLNRGFKEGALKIFLNINRKLLF